MDLNLIISIVSLIVSLIALIASFSIYNLSKKDYLIDSFYAEFTEFLANASQVNNEETLKSLIRLKLRCGFLNSDLYCEFTELLPILEHLNLTQSNPNSDSDWDKIITFIYNFTKAYNKKTGLSKSFIQNNL